MDIVNRSIVIVYCNEKMVEMLNSLPEYKNELLSQEEMNLGPAVFLVPEFEEIEDAIEYLSTKKNDFFKFMIDAWSEESNDIMSNIDIDSTELEEWFYFQFSPMVVDFDYVPVVKEKLIVE